MRRDLPLGTIAAQLIHAAGRSANALATAARAVALAARDEHALAAIGRRLRFEGIAHVLVHEPDPPHHGALMAIGVVPSSDRRVASTLRRLPLLADQNKGQQR